jgi:hypothetical protein
MLTRRPLAAALIVTVGVRRDPRREVVTMRLK